MGSLLPPQPQVALGKGGLLAHQSLHNARAFVFAEDELAVEVHIISKQTKLVEDGYRRLPTGKCRDGNGEVSETARLKHEQHLVEESERTATPDIRPGVWVPLTPGANSAAKTTVGQSTAESSALVC